MDKRHAMLTGDRRIEPSDITPDKTQITLEEKAPQTEAVPDGDSTQDKDGKPSGTIQSVDRALEILECIAQSSEPMKLQTIAQTVGLKSPTCYHLLNSLVARGYVRRNAQPRTYRLGSKLSELSRTQGAALDIRDAARETLVELAKSAGTTACMSNFSGTNLTLSLEIEARGGISLIGYREALHTAAHATALGKAILAWLPESQIARVIADHHLTPFTERTITTLGDLVESLRQVRRHGFAVEDGEYRSDVSGLAVAIRDRSGSVIGSVGCLIPRDSDEITRMGEMQREIRMAAKAISGLF